MHGSCRAVLRKNSQRFRRRNCPYPRGESQAADRLNHHDMEIAFNISMFFRRSDAGSIDWQNALERNPMLKQEANAKSGLRFKYSFQLARTGLPEDQVRACELLREGLLESRWEETYINSQWHSINFRILRQTS